MITAEKPFNVEVAEALGWSLVEYQYPKNPMNMADNGSWVGYPPKLALLGQKLEIPSYNTDWSATGPLIERYRLELCGPSKIAPKLWSAGYESLDNPPYQHYAEAEAPLIAVCHLILALHEAGKLPNAS